MRKNINYRKWAYLIFLLLVSFFNFAQAREAPIESHVIRLSPDLDLIASTRFRASLKPITSEKLVYPLLEAVNEESNSKIFNQQVNAVLDEEVKKFRNTVKNKFNPDIAATLSNKHFLSLDYNAAVFNPGDFQLVSVRFSLFETAARNSNAHLNYRTLNFDLRSGRELVLADLFSVDSGYLERIADYVTYELRSQFEDDSVVKQDALSALDEHYRNWNLLPQGILFSFPKGEVLPESFGAKAILVPYAELLDIINNDSGSIVALCAKTPKKCRRNLVLTGGFSEFKTF